MLGHKALLRRRAMFKDRLKTALVTGTGVDTMELPIGPLARWIFER